MTDQKQRVRPRDTAVGDAASFFGELSRVSAEIAIETARLEARKRVRAELVVKLLDLGWSERDVARAAGTNVRVHQIKEASR